MKPGQLTGFFIILITPLPICFKAPDFQNRYSIPHRMLLNKDKGKERLKDALHT
jgi:hypothetical protein